MATIIDGVSYENRFFDFNKYTEAFVAGQLHYQQMPMPVQRMLERLRNQNAILKEIFIELLRNHPEVYRDVITERQFDHQQGVTTYLCDLEVLWQHPENKLPQNTNSEGG